jgi:ankyrin repeat protein
MFHCRYLPSHKTIACPIQQLPLHYACAFGASEEVLYVLTEACPEAINAKDKRERTPLHFALSNAGRKTVPAAVRLLLSLNREIVNSIDNGPVPLRVLAEYAATIKREDENREEKRESVFRCLDYRSRPTRSRPRDS